MRKTIIFALPIFLLLNFYLCSAAEQPKPVREHDGKELRAGEQYYILPVTRGRGGGVTLGRPLDPNEICPGNAVQARREVERGTPVTFTPVDSKKGVIRVSTDLNIRFNAITVCIESLVWRRVYAESIGQNVIVTDGVEGNPGCETINNWFKIEEYNSQYNWYALRFCPTVGHDCKPICKDVGIYFDPDGSRRLALSEEPFLVYFTKA